MADMDFLVIISEMLYKQDQETALMRDNNNILKRLVKINRMQIGRTLKAIRQMKEINQNMEQLNSG